MQQYQDVKSYLLSLIKGYHYEKVWVVPKDSRIKPHWRTVYVSDDKLTLKVPTQLYTQSNKNVSKTPQFVKDMATAHQAKFKDKASFLTDLKNRGIAR